MARKAVAAPGSGREEGLPPATLARRAGWLVLTVAWLFLSVALASFDSGDAPSHVVAVHNDPPRNLCGVVGAFIAYHAYVVLGVGVWVLAAGMGAFLVVTVTGRLVTHTLVRTVGVVFMGAAVSGFHELVLAGAGPLVGAKAGLVAKFVVTELSARFSGFGTGLALLAMFAVGATVAFDALVMAIPRAALVALGLARRAGSKLPRISMESVLRRPEEPAAAPALVIKGRRIARGGVAIDPDAGGLGATESFDPEEHAVEDGGAAARIEGERGEPHRGGRAPLSAEELRAKIARLPVRMTGGTRTIARDEDIPRLETFEGYQFPTLDLLEDPEDNFSEKMEAFVREQAQILEQALQTYGIDGEVVGIESGPVVTLYSVQLAPGTRVARVQTVASDLARALQSQNIRLVANQAGKSTIGIEVPNLHKERVRLKELMSGGHARNMVLPMYLGKDASGEPLVADLTRMPHMLIAGTTGSGKSVCINTIIVSWLYTKRPDELKLVLVDPKMVEMSQFADIPHLMCPVVTESSRAAAILEWAVNKMEERYELLREAMVRDVSGYNQLSEVELIDRFQPASELERARIPRKLPYMVFIIDELADLIMTHKEVEHSIVRIAQKARAVGIHLILATQRPQANVVTGLIKSNMPCRMSFKVASGMDSRIVLDQKGAELLLGQGDMLFLTPHTSAVKRAQGTLVTDPEIRRVVKFLKTVAAPTFERSLMAIRPGAGGGGAVGDGGGELDGDPSLNERDPMFDDAVRIMIETGRGSVSLLQRRLAIGYSRASRLVDQMGLAGILGEHKGSVAREVMITLEEWEQMKAMEAAAENGDRVFSAANAGTARGRSADGRKIDDDAAEYGAGDMDASDGDEPHGDDVPVVETIDHEDRGPAAVDPRRARAQECKR
jgi:S-DNA-T family DNA segregation ATPase FtsK/SpoIIIE